MYFVLNWCYASSYVPQFILILTYIEIHTTHVYLNKYSFNGKQILLEIVLKFIGKTLPFIQTHKASYLICDYLILEIFFSDMSCYKDDYSNYLLQIWTAIEESCISLIFSSPWIIIVKPLKRCQIIPSASWYF